MLGNVLMIAPGHNELDRRVNRSLEGLVSICESIFVMYEKRLSADKKFHYLTRKYNTIQYSYVDIEGKRFGLLPDLTEYFTQTDAVLPRVDTVYIHDSGIQGILLALKAKKLYPQARIIYDYHDWIPWEVYYQLSKKLNNRFLLKLAYRSVLMSFKTLVARRARMDAIVGISQGQIEALKSLLGKRADKLPALVVPNTRVKLETCHKPIEDTLTIVWVGAIMEGRDLSRLLVYLNKFKTDNPTLDFTLAVIGEVVSDKMLEQLLEHNFVKALGPFSGDQGVLDLLPKNKCIGVFLGWNDDFGTGINAIASPNKIYSYMNLGIPFISDSQLSELANEFSGDCGLFIDDYDSFQEAVKKIADEYDTFYQALAARRNKMMWDGEVARSQKEFFSSL